MGVAVGIVLAGIGLTGLLRTRALIDWFARVWPRDFGEDLEPLASFTFLVRLLALLVLIAGILLVVASF